MLKRCACQRPTNQFGIVVWKEHENSEFYSAKIYYPNKLTGDMIERDSCGTPKQSTYFKNYLWINVDDGSKCTLEKEMEIIS